MRNVAIVAVLFAACSKKEASPSANETATPAGSAAAAATGSSAGSSAPASAETPGEVAGSGSAAAGSAASPSAAPGTLEARAETIVSAIRTAKSGNGPSIEPLLAEKVTLRFQHAADEKAKPDQVLARGDAAKRLTDTVEGFVAGDRQTCDARCCKFDTKFQHGDTMAAIASICFDKDLVTEVEAQP